MSAAQRFEHADHELLVRIVLARRQRRLADHRVARQRVHEGVEAPRQHLVLEHPVGERSGGMFGGGIEFGDRAIEAGERLVDPAEVPALDAPGAGATRGVDQWVLRRLYRAALSSSA